MAGLLGKGGPIGNLWGGRPAQPIGGLPLGGFGGMPMGGGPVMGTMPVRGMPVTQVQSPAMPPPAMPPQPLPSVQTGGVPLFRNPFRAAPAGPAPVPEAYGYQGANQNQMYNNRIRHGAGNTVYANAAGGASAPPVHNASASNIALGDRLAAAGANPVTTQQMNPMLGRLMGGIRGR